MGAIGPETLSYESANVVDGNVGEAECLGLRHPAIGYLGNGIHKLHAHLLENLFAAGAFAGKIKRGHAALLRPDQALW